MTDKLREALQEILRVHANDDHRPRAFYIAAEALSEQDWTAMRAAAQPAQGAEPVAFDVRCDDCGGNGLDRRDNNYRCAPCLGSGFVERKLYTSAPAQVTETELDEIAAFVRLAFGKDAAAFNDGVDAMLAEVKRRAIDSLGAQEQKNG